MPTITHAQNQKSASSNKLLYIDNIKVLLTILVVLHHTFIAYSSSNGWYYNEETSYLGVRILATAFVSINQSFFMGYFFLLAAYFTSISYSKKGALLFLKDRIIRLGIPLVFYSLILTPFICYLVYYYTKKAIPFYEYISRYDSWIDLGVTWFVAALLLFTFVYVVTKKIIKINSAKIYTAPNSRTILIFAAGLGIITFGVRILFPVGCFLEPFGFQLGHFPQYIALFIIGLIASKNNWLDQLSEKTGQQLKRSAKLCLLLFPLFLVIRLALNTPVSWFSGGFHWQALLYAIWEQCIGISILTAILIKGKTKWNTTSKLLTNASRSSFAVYIFHPLVIVIFSLLARNWNVDPAIKLLITSSLIIFFSFTLGALIVSIPGVKRVF